MVVGDGEAYFCVKCMGDWYGRKGAYGEDGRRKPKTFILLHFKCSIYAKWYLKLFCSLYGTGNPQIQSRYQSCQGPQGSLLLGFNNLLSGLGEVHDFQGRLREQPSGWRHSGTLGRRLLSNHYGNTYSNILTTSVHITTKVLSGHLFGEFVSRISDSERI